MTPVRYNLLFDTVAKLQACAADFSTGDTAYVAEHAAAFVYDESSTEAPYDGIVLNGPGGVGRWIIESLHIFGGLYTSAGATPFALTQVPSKLTTWTGALPSNRVAESVGSSQIAITRTSVYQVALSLSGTVSGAGNYDFHPAVDGVRIPGAGIYRIAAGASSPIGGTTITFANIVAGSVVTVLGSVDAGSATVTIVEASLSLIAML